MKKGQTQLGVIFAGFALISSIFGGISWNAFARSDKALEKVSAVETQTARIEGKLDILLSRMGITQLEVNQKLILASSSQPFNGHR